MKTKTKLIPIILTPFLGIILCLVALCTLLDVIEPKKHLKQPPVDYKEISIEMDGYYIGLLKPSEKKEVIDKLKKKGK